LGRRLNIGDFAYMSKEKVMKGRWGEEIKVTVYDEGVVINNNGMWIYLYWEDWRKVKDFIEDMRKK